MCRVSNVNPGGSSSFALRSPPFLRRSHSTRATRTKKQHRLTDLGQIGIRIDAPWLRSRTTRKWKYIMPMRGDAHGCDVLDSAKEKKKKSNAVQESVQGPNWNARVRREGKRTIMLKKNSARAYTCTKKVHRGSRDTTRMNPCQMLEVLDEIGEVSLQLKVTGKRLAVDSPEVSPSNLNWAKIDYYGGISVADYRTARS